jgi:hypothetical protein
MLNSMQGDEGETLSPEKIEKLSKMASSSMQGLKSMAFVMGVGDANDGIYGRTVGIMHVDDAHAFLRNYNKSFLEMMNLMKGSPWTAAYTVEEMQIDGKLAVHLTMDMSKFQLAGSDPEQVMTKYYDKMFGNDGKLSVYLTAASDSTVVMAYTSIENLKRVLDASNSNLLASDPQLKETAAMLPADAQWAGFISPGGIMEFASHMIGVFAPEANWDLGEFPTSPPVGFAVELAPTYLDGHLVVPVETLDAAKKFVEQMQQ